MSACFVANDNVGQIAGYYTLASASILLSDLPETLAKKLPRYPSVPAVRMGRLAVSDSFKGKGLGAALLAFGTSVQRLAPTVLTLDSSH